jgi:hypothetical protein
MSTTRAAVPSSFEASAIARLAHHLYVRHKIKQGGDAIGAAMIIDY